MQYSLKELRARKGWTQKETAQKLGVSEQTYNAWEKDASGVTVSKVNAWAILFGVTLSEIFLNSNMKNIHVKLKAGKKVGDMPGVLETVPEIHFADQGA